MGRDGVITSMEWRMLAAQSTGRLHRQEETGCQDSWTAACGVDGTFTVVVVADGAGSAKYAEVGSALAAHAAVAHLCRELSGGRPADPPAFRALAAGAFSAARAALVGVAGDGSAVRGYATTLLVAGIVSAADGDTVFAGAVGDGAIVVAQDQEFRTVAVCERSEYVNETFFVTEDDYADHLVTWCEPVPGLTGFALLTDGVEALSVSHRGTCAHAPFFAAVLKHVAAGGEESELLGLLESPRAEQQSQDDKTLVVAARAA